MDPKRAETIRAEVRAAAARLVAAFASHDREGYFAAFSPDASFLFHSSPEVFATRAEYRAEWERWEADGFHVDACETTDTRVEPLTEDVAVLTHAVRTTLAGGKPPLSERETIVFWREPGGAWVGVHEHLSPHAS